MVCGDNIQITNGLALLVGGVADVYDDGRERLRQRLIAFKAPSGPPLDVTDQILLRYSAASGVPMKNMIADSFVWLTQSNDAVTITFSVVDSSNRAAGADAAVPWKVLEGITADVGTNGTWKTEKWSGVRYMRKDLPK